MNIEVLLTEAEIATEFAESLEARDLPEKFFYWLPVSIQAWRVFAASTGEVAWTEAASRISSHLADFKDIVPVISLGAGDGLRDRLILAAVRAARKALKYFPVDASQSLLEIACSGAEDEEYEACGIKADISSRVHVLLAADIAEPPRLFLMTGNTLGCFDPLEQIRNVAEAMRPGDRLVVDGDLNSAESAHRLESPEARDFAFAPLASLGLTLEDGRVRFEHKEDNRRPGLLMVSKYFHADRDLRILAGGKEVPLARGERVFMNFRYLFTQDAFNWLLEEHAGLKVADRIVSREDGRIIAICSL